MSLDRVLKDPRLVTMDHNGEKLHFAYSRRAVQIAEQNHGYNEERALEQASSATGAASSYIENVLRLLWVCHLPFEPDLTFEEFDSMFFPVDYAKLGKAWNDVMTKQVGLDANTPEPEPEKKQKGRAKKR